MTEAVPICSVEDVLINDELERRPSRPPDFAAENRALAALAEAMGENPELVLQRLVETAMELTSAESAGISLLEPGGAHGQFRWVATAGAWAPYRNGTMSREASPCGEVIDRDAMLLLSRPARAFAALLQVDPGIGEGLLAPFHVEGSPIGTVWVIKHAPDGRFEQEDARLLASLAHFASVAHRVVLGLETARAGEQVSREALKTELSRSRALQRLSTRLIPEQSPEALYEQVMDTALELMDADAVSIQLLDDDGKRLRRVAARNLHPDSTEYWTWVDASHASTCGQALDKNQRVMLEDVEAAPELAGTGDLMAFRASGTRAVQSSPLLTRTGRPVGMISTHWHSPRTFGEGDFALFDILARQLADLVERSKAEAALREAEERQRLTIELVPALLWSASPDGQEIALNERWLAYTGQSEGEIQNYGWLDAIHPDDLPATQAAFEHAFATGEPLEREHRIHKASDGYRWHVIRHVPVRDAHGVITRWFGAAVDIHENKLAEQALQESEERLQRVLDTAAVGVLFFNPEGYLVDANETFLSMTGYSRGQVTPGTLHWRDMTPPEWVPASEAQMVQFAETGRIGPYEKEYLRVDGTRRWMLFAGRDLGDGSIAEFAVDITDRKQAEAALQKSEMRFREFGENSSDALWIVDAETMQLEYLSPAFERIWGEDRAGVMSDLGRWAELVHPEDRELAGTAMPHVLAGEPFVIDYRIIRPDGEVRWIRDTGFPISDAGAVKRAAGIAQDVTNLKNADERQKLLLAELQHRVRNLLGMTRSLVRQSSEGHSVVEDYVAHLVGRLDAMARTQVLLTRAPGAKIDLETIVRDELLACVADESLFKLTGPRVELSPRAAEVLTLALHELATNSIKYGVLSRGQGKLAVSWGKDHKDDLDCLRLTWEERGRPAPRLVQRGFGSELIEQRVPYELKGRAVLEMTATGMRCEIVFPLTDGTSVLESGPAREPTP